MYGIGYPDNTFTGSVLDLSFIHATHFRAILYSAHSSLLWSSSPYFSFAFISIATLLKTGPCTTSTTATTLVVRKIPVTPLFLWLSTTPTMSLIFTSRLLSVRILDMSQNNLVSFEPLILLLAPCILVVTLTQINLSFTLQKALVVRNF